MNLFAFIMVYDNKKIWYTHYDFFALLKIDIFLSTKNMNDSIFYKFTMQYNLHLLHYMGDLRFYQSCGVLCWHDDWFDNCMLINIYLAIITMVLHAHSSSTSTTCKENGTWQTHSFYKKNQFI